MKWISVSERLPDLKIEVLCRCEIGAPNGVNSKYKGLYSAVRRKMDNCDIIYWSCENSYSKVTHWQNLPEPPTVR